MLTPFNLGAEDFLFYGFALCTIVSALLVVFLTNQIYSALFLALTMSILGIFYFMLEAYFVSVAQITVYAGAVMVLFVMVVMLFDLRHEGEEILKFSPLTIIKVLVAGLLCGFFIGTGWIAIAPDSQMSTGRSTTKMQMVQSPNSNNDEEDLTSAEAAALVEKPRAEEFGSTLAISRNLFTKYVFAFEAVSVLLLIAIVGAVALAKSRGGTHHAT